ncbi:M48 family metallopeptidase [Phenylobacterium sp. LH3H17]|uniref:M48 family metallopeptidase n=1 Tax=Phenylobacterium sp. LH3H17 TaxID=2903901 RepID=UPI0020C9EABC|nr:M48 family metallopeptidase [Phenylobacterium sp. LH3H17]UTP40890.1 M48 family metallopeptidase [Phenylobacterium sp. LH3H17]
MTCACATRRGLLAGLTCGVLVAGCSENAATGRRQFAPVPDDQLSLMADQAWAQVRAEAPVLADAASQARLARVGTKLAKASRRADLAWEFTVFDRPEVNAFVLPNGKVGTFRGLMEFTRDDDELGAVIGHEIGHVIARHPAERVSQQLAVEVGVGLVQAVLANGDYAEHAGDIAGALGMGAMYGVILPYSRKHELEADRVGLDLMQQAGMDPGGALRFFGRMAETSASRPQPPEVLSTHPADAARLKALREAVAALPKG